MKTGLLGVRANKQTGCQDVVTSGTLHAAFLTAQVASLHAFYSTEHGSVCLCLLVTNSMCTCLSAAGESGRASDLAVARATGNDKVFSRFSVRRRFAAMAVSASALLRSPEAAAERLAKGLCSTGDGDRGPRITDWPREASSMPWLTAVAMALLAVGVVVEEEEAMASV